MFVCVLCEKESCYTCHLCAKCRRIKHLLNLYDGRVYEVLENVLIRNEEGQLKKESQEIQKDIDKKERYNLRKKEAKQNSALD